MEPYNIAQSIKQGLADVELIEKGIVTPKSIDDLLHEL